MKKSYACVLLTFLLLFAWPFSSLVQAGSTALEWTVINKPGDSGNLVVTPSEVSEITVGKENVIYAIDIPNSKLYRSLDGGATWKDITSYLDDAGAGLPATKIAIAPDKPGIVAVVTNAGTKVYLSTDGGTEWTDTGVPDLDDTIIQTIAISDEYSQGNYKFREIAFGTAVWGDDLTTGQLWIRRSGDACYPVTWTNQDLVIDPSHPGGEVSALAYSPKYSSDATILVVASTGGDVAPAYQDMTWLCLLKRDTLTWNGLPGYPVEIAPGGDGGVSSSLALPSDYSGSAASSRQLFVSYDREPDTSYDDVYCIDDVSVHRLNVAGGSAISISSLAYKGNLVSGTLLAGAAEPITGSLTVQVWRTSQPWELSPEWNESSVPPTGPSNAKVAWSADGTLVYCGTGQIPGITLDESAFSASSDGGDKWRQMGLIDTVIKIADVVPAPDGESMFLVTYNEYGPEGIWRTAGDPLGNRWERLLTMDTTSNGIILRLSLDYEEDYTLYAAEADGTQLAVSHTRGNSWSWCRFPPGNCPGEPIIDLVVASEDIVYTALPGGYVTKTTSGGARTWTLVDSGLDEINMLALFDENTVFVGGQNGDVAYSSDGGASFTLMDEVIASGSGEVQVVADVSYPENNTIFAATNLPDEGIWRWVIGVSTDWEQIDEIITELGTGQCISGLIMGSESTLYALRLEPASANGGGVLRTLNPREANVEDIEFDLINDDLPAGTTFDPNSVYSHTLPYLKLSGNNEQNELWTVDTTNHLIYRYQDTLCKFGTALTTPQSGDVVPVDADGYVTDLVMCWEGLTGATKYEVNIYWEWVCTQLEWSGTSDSTAIIATEGTNPARLLSGTEYYWRVRAIEPIKSPWSEVWSFTSALTEELWTPLSDNSSMSPSCGASDVPIKPDFCWQSVEGATGYEFILARDEEFSDVVIAKTGADALANTVWGCDIELDYTTTYFWKVRAISDISYSEWGACLFTTEAVTSTTAAPSQTPTTPPTVITNSSIPSYMIMVLIGIGAALVISLIVFAVRTR